MWIAHLAQLPQLGTLHHHAWLLQELYQQTLPLDPGMRVMEIGCGTGDFAQTLAVNQMYRRAHTSHAPHAPVHYLGIDSSREGLSAAEQAFRTLNRELQSTFADVTSPAPTMTAEWIHSEWGSHPAPFPHPLDRIVGHLSLSFANSPLALLRNAGQALTPGGRLVITCMQPHADLARLYREQLHTAGQDELSPSAQIFLHYLGRLHEAVRHGLLHAFDREQLSDLMTHAGFIPVRIVPILDGQLLIATARKGKSAG